ncbi:MAG: hypothetical protein WC343_03725 [Bacilli bacterium]|jgi:hypothetical protein
MTNENLAKPLSLESVNQESQPEEVEVNVENLENDVESNNEPTSEDLAFNRQKELERRINEVKKSQEEVKKLERELHLMKQEVTPKFSEQEFLGTLARRHDIMNDNGEPDIVVTKKLIGLVNDVLQNTIEPRLSEFEKTNTLKSFDDYEIYQEQVNEIMENELSDVNCSKQKKAKIAYEIAKSRNPIKVNSQSVAKPNMLRSSVSGSKPNKSGLSQSEVLSLTKQAEEMGLDPKSVIKRAEKLRQGYRGA